jgi:hypothetical protein
MGDKEWKGDDRREYCPGHGPMSESVGKILGQMEMIIPNQETIFEKIDDIMKKASENHTDIVDIKRMLSNGIHDKLASAATKLDVLCLDHETRMKTLDDFKWFMTLANKFHDNMLLNLIKLFIGLVIGTALIHITNTSLVVLIKKIASFL